MCLWGESKLLSAARWEFSEMMFSCKVMRSMTALYLPAKGYKISLCSSDSGCSVELTDLGLTLEGRPLLPSLWCLLRQNQRFQIRWFSLSESRLFGFENCCSNRLTV